MNPPTFTLVTPPTVEPVTVAEVKAFAKIEHSSENALIGTLITTARQAVEASTGRALIAQTWNMQLDRWPCSASGEADPWPFATAVSAREVDLAPLPIFNSVSLYVDQVEITENYRVSADGTLRVKSSVADSTDELGDGIVLEYVAGYGDSAAAVPQPLKTAILRYAAHLYEHREESIPGFAGFPPALGVDALITPYKVIRL